MDLLLQQLTDFKLLNRLSLQQLLEWQLRTPVHQRNGHLVSLAVHQVPVWLVLAVH
jgi:hypothetical protein